MLQLQQAKAASFFGTQDTFITHDWYTAQWTSTA